MYPNNIVTGIGMGKRGVESMLARRMTPSILKTAVITLILLAISLAVYSRTYTGWVSPEEYEIQVTNTEFGVPHWLTFNRLDSEGSAPPIDPVYLPEADRYKAGWQLRTKAFSLALLLCITIALPLAIAIRTSDKRRWPRRVWATYTLIFIATSAIEFLWRLLVDQQQWLGLVLILIGLPTCLVTASAVLRSYIHSILLAVSMVAVFWWAQRISDVFYDDHLIHGLPEPNELWAMVIIVCMFAALGLIATAAGRYVVGRVSSQHSN
jgi:drug/metabolite transporter superfamily protein YnfA